MNASYEKITLLTTTKNLKKTGHESCFQRAYILRSGKMDRHTIKSRKTYVIHKLSSKRK